MKTNSILFLLFISCLGLKCQTKNTVNFSYDKAGNIIQRQIQVMPPIGGRLSFHADSNMITKTSIEFKIYPNPTNQYINVEGELPDNIKDAQIEIISSNGQLLKTDSYYGEKKMIDVSSLKTGIYLLEILYTKSKKSTYKIVITN